jgi:hypothetical protein
MASLERAGKAPARLDMPSDYDPDVMAPSNRIVLDPAIVQGKRAEPLSGSRMTVSISDAAFLSFRVLL